MAKVQSPEMTFPTKAILALTTKEALVLPVLILPTMVNQANTTPPDPLVLPVLILPTMVNQANTIPPDLR